MKFLSFGFLVLLCSIFITNCSNKDDDKISSQISSDKTSITIQVQGGTEYINISANAPWELTDLPSWLKVSPTSGSGNTKVEIVCDPNITANELKANINLKSSGISAVVISVTQLQPDISITGFTEH